MDSDTTDTARGLLMLRRSLPSLWRTPWIRRTPRILWRTRTLWIRIRKILLRQIDYYQFEVPFTSAAVSVLP